MGKRFPSHCFNTGRLIEINLCSVGRDRIRCSRSGAGRFPFQSIIEDPRPYQKKNTVDVRATSTVFFIKNQLYQKGKLIPRLKLAFELRGIPCLASLPKVWSIPRNILKPVVWRLSIQPKSAPKVPTPRLMSAEKIFTGATFADRRK